MNHIMRQNVIQKELKNGFGIIPFYYIDLFADFAKRTSAICFICKKQFATSKVKLQKQ
jgi:hypothetical protein